MKILLIHNFYQQFGGEDRVVLQEQEALQKNHEVVFYSRHNDELLHLTLAGKAGAAKDTIHSRRTTDDIRTLVSQHHPDVAYVHNVYPLISPSVYHALHELGVPIVQVIHDFRPLCSNGWFYNDTGVCERCKLGNHLHAVRHRCYKDGYAYSALCAAAMTYMHGSGALDKVDAFVCLTDFARRKLMSAGIPQRKLFVRSNCIDAETVKPAIGQGEYVGFIGRLSKEKGIWTLIHAMERLNGPVLKIAGTGPEQSAIHEYIIKKAIHNVELLGFLSGDARQDFLNGCLFTVMPSEWYEMFPMVLLESWASGKPVLGSRLGATSDLIDEGNTGLLFVPGDAEDLAKKIEHLCNAPVIAHRMGKAARSLVESQYDLLTSEASLMDIFHKVGCGDSRDSAPILERV